MASTRSSTSSNESWLSCGSSSSSQVRGAATFGCALPRSEYGHFGPLEQPQLVAQEIAARLDLLAAGEEVGC